MVKQISYMIASLQRKHSLQQAPQPRIKLPKPSKEVPLSTKRALVIDIYGTTENNNKQLLRFSHAGRRYGLNKA